MIMTYISELRIEDPNVETNLLIKKTWLLNGVIEQSQMLAWAVQFGSVDCLMRFVIQKAGFVALHEKLNAAVAYWMPYSLSSEQS
jgi:hypothetical protein